MQQKKPSARFFIGMSSMCVQLFTAFVEAVLTLYVDSYLGECPTIKHGRHLHENEARGKIILLFLHIFHTDHNKCTMKGVGRKMSKTVFRPATPLKITKSGNIGTGEHWNRGA